MAMILKYYKISFDYKKLKKGLGVFSYGTFTPQLGLYLLRQNLKVKIVTLHPALFNIKSRFKNSKEIVKHFEKIAPKFKSSLNKASVKFFLEFLKEGGEIIPKIPDLKTIQSEIIKGRPLISALTHWFLFNSKLNPRFTLHFNVVTGFDKNYIYVNDPDWGKPFGGKHKHKIKNYLFAIHASAQGATDQAALMLIQKSKLKLA